MRALSDELTGCSRNTSTTSSSGTTALDRNDTSTVVRFQTLLQRLQIETEPDWAQLALEHGFYDQSHMVNLFQEMTGHTPTRYMEAKGPFLNWLPVN